MEGGKVKLVLISEAGKVEESFIIPTKSKLDLMIPAAEKGGGKSGMERWRWACDL